MITSSILAAAADGLNPLLAVGFLVLSVLVVLCPFLILGRVSAAVKRLEKMEKHLANLEHYAAKAAERNSRG